MKYFKELNFYILNEEIENEIENILVNIFSRHGKEEFAGVIFTCVKELIINAAKANLKRVLFEEHNMNIDNEEEYIAGMLRFREELNNFRMINYEDKLQAKNYWVKVTFESNANGISIEVINNAHITKIEEKRLREKLKKAMSYNDIAQFYLEQGDEIEGAGMGIALVVMLLKGLGADPSLFRLGNTKGGQTLIRIEIPLTAEYVSKRELGVH
ncbi:MAG: histidine kinase [Brevinematia bacterium]